MGKLADKVAIVTGAGQGLGLAFATALAKEGAKVTIAEFNAETGAQAAKPSVKLLDITLEDMEVPWKTGPVASLFFMQACVPHMIDSNYGRIINLCSDTGIEGMPTFGAYGSAKESIRSLTRVAAREFGEYGITVNVVSPGALTPAAKRWMEHDPEGYRKTMEPVPLGRLGDPEKDLAPTIVFLASEDARFMTGQTVFINGGHTFGR